MSRLPSCRLARNQSAGSSEQSAPVSGEVGESQTPQRATRGDPITHYCIVRRDLPVGLAMAQLVHAAGESSPGFLDAGTYAVVLGVDNEEQLTALARSLATQGVAHVPIIEPDLGHAMTAIGVVPAPRSALRKFFKSLSLYAKG